MVTIYSPWATPVYGTTLVHGQGSVGIGEWSASAILIPGVVAMVTTGGGTIVASALLLYPLLTLRCCCQI